MTNAQYPYGNQSPPGGQPYPYGPQGAQPQDSYVLQQLSEKRRIRLLSSGAALATGGFLLLANLLYLPYLFLVNRNVLNGATEAERVMNMSVDLLITLVALFLPFYLLNRIYKNRMSIEPVNLGKPKTGTVDTLLLLVAGFGMMMLADVVTGYLSSFFQDATGAEFAYDFFATPTSALGVAIYAVRSTLFPAIFEEYAMRGVVMNSLRRYGDMFAILMSAMMFGLMHGNMVQVPFAFAAGIVLGYVVIRTETLWTGVAIHFLNNSFSIIYSLLYDNGHESVAETFSLIGTYGGLALGVVCLIILFVRKKMTRPAPNRSFLRTKQCVGAFFLTIPMIVILIYMVVQTALMVKFPS